MSRIGKQPIAVPADVKVQVTGGKVAVEGKKGKLEFTHHPNIIVKYDTAAKAIAVTRPDDERLNRALHGLTRSLIANMVEGVTKGYEKKLKIEGLGYSAKLDKKAVVLTVGFANAITLTPPDGVTVEIGDKDGTVIIVKACALMTRCAITHDKQKVGQFAAEIRASRKPEPYKGKGIRYENETVRRKEGKSFASGG